MANADLDRLVTSEGAFGFYDRIPEGDYEFGTVSYPTGTSTQLGLRNTIVVTLDVASGSSVDLLYSQNYNFFSARLEFSGSVNAFGVDLGSLSIRSNSVSITLGTEQFIYNAGNLDRLQADLEANFVPTDIAAELADAVSDAFSSIRTVETGIRNFVETLDSTNFSQLSSSTDVDLGSQTASASGDSVDIGNIVNVVATSFDDTITGSGAGNSIDGGGGSDVISGGGGNDIIDGGAGSDELSGGSGFDTYYTSSGDTVEDSDGSGAVFLGDLKLTGGTREEEEGEPCEPGNDNESDENNVWTNKETGETYTLEGSTLTVSSGGSSITINNFSNGQLGIRLEDESTSDGDDCDPTPDEYASPLVLDLDGDGIELTSLAASGAYFDIDNDGLAERTGWVNSDDGLLAFDRDGDGKITSGNELFGYGETYSGGFKESIVGPTRGTSDLVDSTGLDIDFESGFALLGAFDTNADNVIDSSDFEFNALRIWRDLNGDGVSQEGELQSLTQAGVASIDLNATRVNETNAGNLITDRSTYTTTDGQQREIVDTWFLFNQYDSRAINPIDIDPDIADLPDLSGAGRLLSLRESMAQDPGLRAKVEAFAGAAPADLAEVTADVKAIMFAWAGVEDLNAFSRGSYADARAVAVMEAFTDTQFQQWSGSSPRPFAGATLNDQFEVAVQFATARLILQSDWGQTLFPEMRFEAGINTVLDAGTNVSTMVDRLVATLPTDPAQALAHLQAGFRVLDLVSQSFENADGVSYAQATSDAIAQAGLDLTYQQVITAQVGGDGDDSVLMQSVSGNQFGYTDTRVVAGGEGDDFIKVGGNQVVVFWGEGQGNDSISLDPVFAQGWLFTSQVVVRLAGVNVDGVSISRASSTSFDGIVRIDATGEELTLRNLLSGRGDASGELQFEDGGTLTFAEIFDAVAIDAAQGTDGNDTLLQRGSVGTLDGGAGDDVLSGSSDDTDYVFDAGSGNDIIRDSGGANRVLFGAGIAQADLQVSRTGYRFETLLIEVLDTDGVVTDSLTINNQFGGDDPLVAAFVLNDGTVLSTSDLLGDFGADGTGDDIVIGSKESDFLAMRAGDDTVFGLQGGDFYSWSVGDGNDRIEDRGDGADFDIFVLGGNLGDFDIVDQGNGAFQFTHRTSAEVVTVGRGIEEFGFNDIGAIDPASLAELAGLGSNGDLTPLPGTTVADDLTGTDGRDEIVALAGNDTVNALDGDDVINAGLGDDIVNAGGGNDFVEGGEGADTITGGAGDDNILGQAGFDSISGGDGNDRIDVGDRSGPASLRFDNIAFGGEGQDVLIGGWENDSLFGGAGDDTINGNFGDDTLEGGAGDDLLFDRDDSTTYIYNLGDGNDVIYDANGTGEDDVLQFGPGITAQDITWSFVLVEGRPDLDYFEFDDAKWGLRGDIAGGGSVTMAGGFNDRVGGLNRVTFDNGDSLSLNDIGTDLRTPTAADQLIVGVSNSSDDVLAGGAGDDTLVGNFGDQVFLFGTGDGDDILLDPYLELSNLSSAGFRTTEIQLGTGLSADNIAISRGGEGDRDVIITLPSGETLTIRSQYDTQQDRFSGQSGSLEDHDWIDQITFVDGGPALDAADLRAAALAATGGDDVQIGTGQDDVIAASAGNDIMRGGFGSDSYSFGIGDGMDRIEETADNIKYAPDDFQFEGGTFDLSLLRETDTLTFGAGITVDNLVLTATGDTLSDISVAIEGNADDTLLLSDQLAPNANWGRATQIGFGGPIEVFSVAAFDLGDPFGPPIGPGGPGGPGGPEGGLGPDGEVSETLWNDIWASSYGAAPLFQAGIETFVFADGTVLDRDAFAALITARDDSGDNTLSTDAAGGTLNGGAGFDTLNGGTGDDVYLFAQGMDQDIANDAGGSDTVAFGAGIQILEVAFTRVGLNGEDLLIELGGTERNALVIKGQFAGDDRRLEVFRFDDGTEITADMIEATLLARAQTPENDFIRAYEGDDLVTGLDGDDVILPLGGNDIVDGGDGRDTLQLQGNRDDYLITQDGDWTVVTDTTGQDGSVRMRNVEVISFADDPDTGADSEVLVANVGPVADDIAFDGREDVALQLSQSALLDGASDPDSTTLTLVSVGNASGGNVQITDDGRVVFTPDADLNGVAGFDYTVADADGATATARATVNLAAVNDPVTAADDTVAATEDQTLTIAAATLLGNDRDIDNDTLTISAVTSDTLNVALNSAGDVVLTPIANAFGNGTFRYTVTDGQTSDSARVNVRIAEVNDDPVFNGLALETSEDVALTMGAALLIAAASDVDGDALFIQSVSSPSGGTVSFAEDVVTFTPNPNFSGEAGFDVTFTDGRGGTVTGRTSVTVTPVSEDPELAIPLADVAFDEDTAIAFAIPAGSFVDGDGTVPTLSATLQDLSALPAWLSFDGTSFNGTPPANFNGDLGIIVTATDETGGTADDAFTLSITAVNDAPEATGGLDNVAVLTGEAVSIDIPTALFIDVDGDTLSRDVTLADGADLPAWLTFDGTALTGTAPAGESGTLDLLVTASDGALSASIGFALEVTAANTAPFAVDDAVADVDAGASILIDAATLLANDGDPDGDDISIVGVSQTGTGSVVLNTDGTITYTAQDGFAGNDSFAYTISDGALSATATVNLTVLDDTGPTDPYEGWYIGTTGRDFISTFWVGNTKVFGSDGRDVIWGGWTNDMLAGGTGRDVLYGRFGDDMLWGNEGRDYLSGGFGSDTLDGGAGRDVLRGGWGNDTFVFGEGYGRDKVADFYYGDKIAIDHDDYSDFASIQDALSRKGNGSELDLGNGDRLKITYWQPEELDQGDFIFL